jgi:diguanylate cyclase (GGDEF)-like protein/PAS domain S-box-containing protein
LFKEEPPELLLTRVAAMARAVRAHRTVEQERRFLSGILSTLSEGVYGVDKQNRITFMNPAGLAILGYSSETEVAGRNPHLLFHYALVDGRPNPAETCYLNQAYELGDVLPNWESVFWTRAGKPIWVECNVVPLVYGGVREGSVVAFRDVTLVREHMEHLHWQAYHDSLTRLPNRRFFADVLEREFYRLKRSEDASAVIYVDLDKFKQVNDLAGHAAGDRLLVELSELLARRLRATDVVARLGGDEFGIILSNVDRRSAVSVAEKFRVMIARHEFEHAGRQYRVDASIGLVLMDRYSWSPDTVLSQADKASYLSKRAGGATVHVYVPEDGNDTV